MKNKWIYIITVLFAGCLNWSCADLLETSPKGVLFPDEYYNSEKNLEAALTGVYDILGSVYGGDYVMSMGNDGDESYYFRSTYTYGPVIYTHTPSDGSITSIWQKMYSGIGRANLLLSKLPGSEVSDVVKNRIKGEALFLRAYYYFILVQHWGRVPLTLEPTLLPVDMEIAQSDLATVYDQIIKDMEEAENLVLPIGEIGFGGRVSKSAVRGMLARVCLYMAGEPLKDKSKYKDARNWAKKVMEDTDFTHELNPSYRQVFINYAQDLYDIKESIWEVEFWGNKADAYNETGLIGNLNGISNNENPEIGIARGMYASTGTMYRRYEADDTLRRDWNIAPFTYSSTEDPNQESGWKTTKVYHDKSAVWHRYLGKYRREEETLKPKASYDTPINFPLLRYADILLMYAEAENEMANGPTGAAYKAINQVRRRAFGKLMPGATDVAKYDFKGMNYNSFKLALMDERSRELNFEALRKPDLIRWGKFVEKMKVVLTEIEDDMISIMPASSRPATYSKRAFENVGNKHVLQPIPLRELSLNSKLIQNPSW